MDIPMALGVQQMGNKLVATCTWYSGDDLDIEIVHPFQRKMIKSQRTGNISISEGLQRADFGPKAETKLYLK